MSEHDDPWERLATELEQALPNLPFGSSLMLHVVGSEGLHVSFEHDERAGLRLTAPSDRFLEADERLGARRSSAMGRLGWLPPVESATQGPRSPTSFYREWPHPVPYGDATKLALETLRTVFAASPEEIGYEAYFHGGRFRIRGLSLEPVELSLTGPTLESNAQELDGYLEAYLGSITNTDVLERDANGNFVMRYGSATIFAGVEPGEGDEPASAWLAAPLLWNVEESEELLRVVNLMNRAARAGRVVWDGSEVAIVERWPSYAVDVQTLAHVFDAVGQLADEYDELLRDMFEKGSTSRSSAKPPAPGPTGYL